MVRSPNNPLGINQHAGDRKQVPLKLPVNLLEEIDNEVAVCGGTRTGFIESACRAALHPESVEQARPTPIAINPKLLKEAISTLASLKQTSLTREKKQKKPDQKLIEQWQQEIEELLLILDD